MHRALAVAMTTTLLMMLVTAGVTLAALLAVDLSARLGLLAMPPREAMIVTAALVLAVLLQSVAGAITGVYRAHASYPRGTLALMTVQAIKAGIVMAGLLLEQSPALIALLWLAAGVIGYGLVVLDLVRFTGIRLPRPVWPDKTERRALMAGMAGYAPTNWSLHAFGHAPPLVIKMMVATPGAVIVFVLSRTLTGLARTVTEQCAHAAASELSRLDVADRSGPLRGVLLNTAGLLGGMAAALGGLVLGLAEPIMTIWTGGAVPALMPLFIILVAAICLSAPAQAPLLYLHYAHKPRRLALARGGATFGGLALGAALTPSLGVVGMALGLMLAEACVIGVWLAHRVTRDLGIPFPVYLWRAYGPAAVTLAISWAAASLAQSWLDPRSVIDLMLAGAVWAVATGPVALFLVTNAQQRAWLLAIASRVLRRDAGR